MWKAQGIPSELLHAPESGRWAANDDSCGTKRRSVTTKTTWNNSNSPEEEEGEGRLRGKEVKG